MNSIANFDVFLDANMIIYISQFKKYDVATWLNTLYNRIYVHIEVLDELRLAQARDLCTTQIELSNWILFDPENSDILNDDQFEIYNSFLYEVRKDFTDFQLTRPEKRTTDKGDIGILAGCRTLSIAVISTQDGDFEKVINTNNYVVNTEEDESGEDVPIEVHNLEMLLLLCVMNDIATLPQVKKFISVVTTHPKRIIDSLESKLRDTK